MPRDPYVRFVSAVEIDAMVRGAVTEALGEGADVSEAYRQLDAGEIEHLALSSVLRALRFLRGAPGATRGAREDAVAVDVWQHELKTWPEYFEAIVRGEKTFDLRCEDDRPIKFQVGDRLRLREWEPNESDYTGAEAFVRVTYVLRGPAFGLAAGHVAMAIVVESVARLGV